MPALKPCSGGCIHPKWDKFFPTKSDRETGIFPLTSIWGYPHIGGSEDQTARTEDLRLYWLQP
jgi:hypothetical protein